MNEELNNNNNNNNSVNTKKALLVPIMSISIFVVLVFAAGYAYYTMAVTNATANGNITTPNRPTLVCSKGDSAVTGSLAALTKTKVGNVVTTATPTLTCTCSGAGKCGPFPVSVAGPSGFSVLAANEFTVGLTSNNATACANNAVHNWAAGQMTTCTIDAGKSVLLTASINWYNINADQSSRANTTYKFTLSSGAGADNWSA